jgi:hypothetical protein
LAEGPTIILLNFSDARNSFMLVRTVATPTPLKLSEDITYMLHT